MHEMLWLSISIMHIALCLTCERTLYKSATYTSRNTGSNFKKEKRKKRRKNPFTPITGRLLDYTMYEVSLAVPQLWVLDL
jgi:hypothetical protein